MLLEKLHVKQKETTRPEPSGYVVEIMKCMNYTYIHLQGRIVLIVDLGRYGRQLQIQIRAVVPCVPPLLTS